MEHSGQELKGQDNGGKGKKAKGISASVRVFDGWMGLIHELARWFTLKATQ
jgi:hypothetical protein